MSIELAYVKFLQETMYFIANLQSYKGIAINTWFVVA